MGDTSMSEMTNKYGMAMMGGLLMLAFIIVVFA